MTRHLHPMFIPTLFTIPALILLLTLGTWQVYRLQWKEALITTMETRLKEAPVAFPGTRLSLPEWEYRQVTLTGTLDTENATYLYAGAHQFRGEEGYRVFCPFTTEEKTSLLVDLGWISATEKKDASWQKNFASHALTLEGLIMKGEIHKWVLPKNTPENNMWFWIELPAMYAQAHFTPLPFYVMRTSAEGTVTPPIPSEASITVRNDHLQYAIIWYAAALSLIVIYVLYYRKNVS